MLNSRCRLTDLFIVFLKIGAFSFGGGYAMLPLIEREVVARKQWVSQEDIIDIFAVTGCLPGAIGLNTAAFIGYMLRGIPGAVVAACANLLPAVFIVLVLSHLLFLASGSPVIEAAFLGIRPVVIGLIVCAACRTAQNALAGSTAKILCGIATFVCITFSHSTIPVMLTSGVIGYILHVLMNSKPVVRKENR